MDGHVGAPVTPRRRSRAWLAGVATLTLVTFGLVGAGAPKPTSTWVPAGGAALAMGLVVWTVIRGRRDRAVFEGELVRLARADAVLAERMSLVGELHDLVSHGLGFITVRASVARHTAARAGEQDDDALAALADIERAARDATAELRRMLAVLRSGDRADSNLAPSPGLDDIARLVAAAETNGLTVHWLGAPPEAQVSAGAGMLAHGVVREALTNAARHAGPTAVDVSAGRCGDLVVVRVADRGPVAGWTSQRGAGQGLRWIADRVGAVGGMCRFGPLPAGGFVVEAEIPDGRAAGRLDSEGHM